MAQHAIICGGSIGGLFAAAALRRAGWNVDVYERTRQELSGRGAGIVTHPQLVDALLAVGADIDGLGVDTHQRVAFDLNGDVVASNDFDQVVTSWDRIHQMLRALLPDENHHLGRAVTGYHQGLRPEAILEDGSRLRADLVVGADGFRSAIRSQMQPDVQPEYAGYLVWRALAEEADLSVEVREQVFGRFGFFLPTGQQIIGYPIAGSGNDLREGHRRYNFVWYTLADADTLADLLTDDAGHLYELTIPPPLVRGDIVQRVLEQASSELPPAFAEIFERSERPFFTPIYDHLSPEMADGHVALVGDAACVARPHVGMGVTKAAQDALSLARHLGTAPVNTALKAFSTERVAASRRAYERARWLGACMFTPPETGTNHDGRKNPNIQEIMRLTAVADF